MSVIEPTVTLIGETVTVSYVADPHVGRGSFTLQNQGPNAVIGAITDVWFESDNGTQPLPMFYVTELDRGAALDPEQLVVDPGAALRFWITFPWIPFEPRLGGTAAVGVHLLIDGTVLEARSTIEVERRFPLDRV